MTCTCISTINKQLKEKGFTLNIGITMDGKTVIPIQTARIDGKKGKTPSMIASHCPFCGVSMAAPKPAGGEG